jgi:hypothetical protein
VYEDAHLGELERRLLTARATDDLVDASTGVGEHDDPARGAAWGPERQIRGNVLRQLLMADNPLSAKSTDAGIRVKGARIVGAFDLEGKEAMYRLSFIACHFDEPRA